MNEILLHPKIYHRIVSVVPSQTEMLFELGLNEEVVGITKFCIHPNEWFCSKTRVGGTKNLNLDTIRKLQPDLILANKEENTRQQIEALQAIFPVYISDIITISQALNMISDIGLLTNKKHEADTLKNKIEQERIKFSNPPIHKKALYLIWHKPWMAAGSNTFIHHMMAEMGCSNATAQIRYPILSEADIIELNPDVVLLSSEPFPFKEKHIREIQTLLPKANIKLVDGELFSWYGSRMSKSFEYFRVLNEELR